MSDRYRETLHRIVAAWQVTNNSPPPTVTNSEACSWPRRLRCGSQPSLVFGHKPKYSS